MNEISVLDGTVKTMTSLQIAEYTGKEHKNVLRDIRAMLKQLGGVLSIEQSYLNSQNKQQPLFNLNYEETMCLVSGYDVPLRMTIIKKWQDLEKGGAPQFNVPTTFTGALRLALEQAEIIEKQTAQLMQAAPAVKFVERYVEHEGAICLREGFKIIGKQPIRFTNMLVAEGVLYRTSAGNVSAKQAHITAGHFVHRVTEYQAQTLVTHKGLEYLANKFN